MAILGEVAAHRERPRGNSAGQLGALTVGSPKGDGRGQAGARSGAKRRAREKIANERDERNGAPFVAFPLGLLSLGFP